jgi:hypothetical protein
MVTKPKTPGTAVAVKKAASANIVSIKEALQAQAADMGNRTAPGSGNTIRVTQDKQFLLPDGTKTPGPLQLVIVDFVSKHTFFEDAFDPKNITPPACFAIGTNPLKLVPSKNSPVVQSTDCSGCPMNQFGSAGTGKACKNSRYMAVLPPDADESTPLWTLATSPTACKDFDGFVGQVSRVFQMPPIGVITTVGFDANKTYAKLTFTEPVPNPNVADHFARQEEARAMLNQEPDVSGFVKVPPARGGKVAARR